MLSDALYAQLQDHYATCRVCTPQADCPTGHDLLMAWGRAESAVEQSVGAWWRPDLERAAIRGDDSLPDPGERTDV